jgi:hypothetical protein
MSLLRYVVTGVRRIRMRPSIWRVDFRHCPAIAHITVSSVRLCPSLKKAHCFRALRTETVLHTYSVLHFSNGIFVLLEIKDEAFCAFSDNFVGLLLSFPEVCEIIGVFTLETDSDVREDYRSELITNIEPFFYIDVVEKCNCASVGYSGLLWNLIVCVPYIVFV